MAATQQRRSIRRWALVCAAAIGIGAAGVIVIRMAAPAAHRPTLAYWLVNDDPEVVAERVRRQSALLEYVTADCMGKLGLPYLPQLEQPPRPDANLPPREFTAKYGFGVTTQLEPAPEEQGDPNLAYVETLPAADREAYRSALSGTDSGPGCREQAARRVISPRDEAIAAADPLIAELANRRAEDPRVKQAEHDWQQCSRVAGFPTSRNEAATVAQSIFGSRLEAIQMPDGTHDQEKLAQLQAEERAIALALFDCDTAYNNVARVATDEVAAAWGQDHAEELTALRAKLLDIDRGLAQMAKDFGIAD